MFTQIGFRFEKGVDVVMASGVHTEVVVGAAAVVDVFFVNLQM